MMIPFLSFLRLLIFPISIEIAKSFSIYRSQSCAHQGPLNSGVDHLDNGKTLFLYHVAHGNEKKKTKCLIVIVNERLVDLMKEKCVNG